MKLPFKLPAFKLPAFKLPWFGMKKADGEDGAEDDDDWDDINTDAPPPPPSVAAADVPVAAEGDTDTPAPAEGDEDTPAATEGDSGDPAGEEDGDPSALAELEDTLVDDSAEDDEAGEETFIGKLLGDKKRLIIVISAAGAGVLVLAGLGWFFFSGDEDVQHKTREDNGIPRFEMAIAPKGRSAESGSLNAIVENDKGPGAGVVVAASTLMAYAKISSPKITDGPLPVMDAPELIEDSRQGPLPKIAEDGRMALQVYAKPYDIKDDRPRIAIIITGLGLSEAATEAAISLLPGSITLAFSPYAPNLQEWADKARQAGHEILIMVPMEPETFPNDDPGPQGLMTTNSNIENVLRLEYVLSRMRGYVGAITAMGSKFNKDEDNLSDFLDRLKTRGLLFIDGSADQKSLAPAMAEKIELAKAIADIVLDTTPTKDAIDANLLELESIARVNAVAVALIDAYPVSIERIATWSAGLAEKNMALAPITAISNRQILQ